MSQSGCLQAFFLRAKDHGAHQSSLHCYTKDY